MSAWDLVGILAGAGAVASAIVGLVLAFRSLRDKGRHAALDEADDLQLALEGCRAMLHAARMRLVDHGIEPP